MRKGKKEISSVDLRRHISRQIGLKIGLVKNEWAYFSVIENIYAEETHIPQKNNEMVVKMAVTESTLSTDIGSSIILKFEVFYIFC